MDSAAVPEVGAPWATRGVTAAAAGGGVGGGGAAGGVAGPDGLPSWNGGTSVQDSYAEQPRRSNPKVSRWSDAPPGPGPVQDVTPGSEGRPSPAGLEPPSKKVRNDSQLVAGQDYSTGAAYVADSGYGEGPPGLAYGQSGTVTTGGEATQNYGQGYGTAYGVQQSYGSQIYGSQYTPAQNAPASFAPGSAKGTGALFYKTKLCTKFKTGSCTFNERCHFAHGMEELRKPPPGWEDMATATGGKPGGSFMGGQQRKTRLCRYFLEGNCPYGDRCNFLHGNEEAQKTPGMEPSSASYTGGMRGPTPARPSYKTRLCGKWEKGEPCDYGDKCHFAHGHAELQGYVGVSSYPAGGTMTADMQYAQPEVVAPNMHADPTMMNPPSLAAPYGAPINYASTGGVNPVMAPAANYNYWDASAAQGQPTVSTQGYVQANQTMPWMSSYSTDGGYSTCGNDTVISQYPQQSQQQQIAQFVGGGTAQDYQAPKQNVDSPYVQDDRQSNYQGEAINGDGNYYQGAYNESNYPSQHADYSARYNMAQAWGGNM